MKRGSLYLLILSFTGLLVLFSCRKDIEYYILDRDRPTSEILEDAKIWYLRSIDKENIYQRLNPHWRDAWQVVREQEESTILVVPASEYRLQNKDISIRRFFIFSMKGNRVVQGNIMEFLGKGYDVTKNLDFLLQSYGRENIEGFDGSVLYYDIDYQALRSEKYVNGQMDRSATSSVVTLRKETLRSLSPSPGKEKIHKTSLAKLASIHPTKKIMSSSSCPNPDQVPVIWIVPPPEPLCENGLYEIYYNLFYISGCLIRSELTYLGHTCPGNGSSSGSGSSSGDESGSSSSGYGEDPPYGGGGAPPPNPLNDLPTLKFCEGNTSGQHSQMINTFTNVLNENCATNTLVKEIKAVPDLTLSLCVDNTITGNGTYSPNEKMIRFSTDAASTSTTVFRHEVFHAYQDNVAYPGGTNDYGSGDPGYVNIEFEQMVFNDIMHGGETALGASTNSTIKDNYKAWITSLTQGGTVYPDISAVPDFETEYFEYLDEFNASHPVYGGGTVLPGLKPEALKALFNGLVKDDCEM